eukprot:8735368-Alexandrium_andersonii.AAC.1
MPPRGPPHLCAMCAPQGCEERRCSRRLLQDLVEGDISGNAPESIAKVRRGHQMPRACMRGCSHV